MGGEVKEYAHRCFSISIIVLDLPVVSPQNLIIIHRLLFELWPDEVCSIFNSKGDNLKKKNQSLNLNWYFSYHSFIFFVMTSFSNDVNGRFLSKITRKYVYFLRFEYFTFRDSFPI